MTNRYKALCYLNQMRETGHFHYPDILYYICNNACYFIAERPSKSPREEDYERTSH